jgi:hypothetical protein
MSGADSHNDAGLLLEASRVFNAAGSKYRKIAEVVSDLAVAAKDPADDNTRTAILCDAAALRLSGRVPGGYEAALKLLADAKPDKSEDDGARVFLLRAFAYGQKYKALARTPQSARSAEVNTIVNGVLEDLRSNLQKAVDQRPSLAAANRHFWDKDAPIRSGVRPDGDQEDDLQAAFEEHPELRTIMEIAEAKANPPKKESSAEKSASPMAKPADQASATATPTVTPTATPPATPPDQGSAAGTPPDQASRAARPPDPASTG